MTVAVATATSGAEADELRRPAGSLGTLAVTRKFCRRPSAAAPGHSLRVAFQEAGPIDAGSSETATTCAHLQIYLQKYECSGDTLGDRRILIWRGFPANFQIPLQISSIFSQPEDTLARLDFGGYLIGYFEPSIAADPLAARMFGGTIGGERMIKPPQSLMRQNGAFFWVLCRVLLENKLAQSLCL